MNDDKIYFVTGGTGTIGNAIIPELLKLPRVIIYLLIRAKDDKHLSNRFDEICEHVEISAEDIKRIKPVRGDLNLQDLGLTGISIKKLYDKVTHIIHSAGNVRMNLTIEESIKESVDVTERMLAFSRKCNQLKKIDFVSTIGVSGKLLTDITEKPLQHEAGFHNNYEAAKYQAEFLLWEGIKEGLPITVHRPSMVVGNSLTGKILNFQVFYFLMDFLKGRQTFGFLPDFKQHAVDIIPVDFVAKAIVISSEDIGTKGRIFHLCSGNQSAPLKELVVFQSVGHSKQLKIKYLPIFLFNAVLKLFSLLMNKKNRKQTKALPYFLAYLGRKQVFGNDKTMDYFNSKQLKLVPFQDYLSKIMTYYQKKIFDNKDTQ